MGAALRGGTRRIADAANAESRAFTRAELLTLGSRAALDSALARGIIRRCLPGYYVGTRAPDGFRARCDAVLRWTGPGAAIAGPAAARLHGLIDATPRCVTVALPASSHPRAPDWARVIRPHLPPPVHTVARLRVVAPADALIQTWEEWDADEAESLLIAAVRDRKVSARDLAAAAERRPRIARRRALSRLVTLLAAGPESYLEWIAMTRVFNTREFAGFARQVRVTARGRAYVLDMFDASARIAVELDGRSFHGDDAARRRDVERDANLATVGITTIRLTFEDIRGRPDWCRDRVRRALAAGRRSRAA